MASELIKHVTDATFEADVLQSEQPILVDYWAEWCGPCKMIAPILDEVSTTYQGKLQIAKMKSMKTVTSLRVWYPWHSTLMLFRWTTAATKVGAMSKAQLTALSTTTGLACDRAAAARSFSCHIRQVHRLSKRPVQSTVQNAEASYRSCLTPIPLIFRQLPIFPSTPQRTHPCT